MTENATSRATGTAIEAGSNTIIAGITTGIATATVSGITTGMTAIASRHYFRAESIWTSSLAFALLRGGVSRLRGSFEK